MNFFTSGRLFAFFFRFPLFSTRCFLLHQRLEARAGIEPAIKLLQSPALPLGYPASQRTRHLRAGACSFKFFQQKPDSQSIVAKTQPHQTKRLANGKGTFLSPTSPPGAHAGKRMSPLRSITPRGDTPKLDLHTKQPRPRRLGPAFLRLAKRNAGCNPST